MNVTVAPEIRLTAFTTIQQFDPEGDEAVILTPQHLLGTDRVWDDAERDELVALLLDLETAELTLDEFESDWSAKAAAAAEADPEIAARRSEVEGLLRNAVDPATRGDRSVLGEGRAYRLYDCTHLPGASVFCCRVSVRDAGWTLGFAIAKQGYSFRG